MIKGVEGILIGSENATALAKFYREVVGLKQTMEFEMGEEGETNGYEFALSGCGIYITYHDKVHGQNSNPDRIILNLEVDDIESEVARMKKTDTKLVQDIYHVEDYGYIATFADPDGNLIQFVQTSPKGN